MGSILEAKFTIYDATYTIASEAISWSLSGLQCQNSMPRRRRSIGPWPSCNACRRSDVHFGAKERREGSADHGRRLPTHSARVFPFGEKNGTIIIIF